MNYLTLTPEHEAKLLEMARDLFPTWYEVTDHCEAVVIDDYIPAAGAGKFISFYNDSGTTRIHWLEFCIMMLGPKLNQSIYKGLQWIEEDEILERHIVDHFYHNYKNYYDS